MAGACVLIFCRWAIGLAFAVSAIGKITSMASFRGTIVELGTLPRRLASPAAIAAVTAEVLAAALVAAGGVLDQGGFLARPGALLARLLRRPGRCLAPEDQRELQLLRTQRAEDQLV